MLFLRMNSTFNSRREFEARGAAALSSAQDSRAALSGSICNYSWQTTTPEGNHTAASRATGGASTRGHHLVSHQTAQSPSRSVTLQSQSGSQSWAFSPESYRLAIHSVKPHRLFHTMHRQRSAGADQTSGVLLAVEGGGYECIDATHQQTNRSEAQSGLSSNQMMQLKLTMAH
jgi:hypothetical protein